MPVEIQLIDNQLPTLLDERTPTVGGAFWYDNPIRVYSPYIHQRAFEILSIYPRATLLDVGSSTGCYSLLARHHPDLTIYAFEPAQMAVEIQRENLRLNGIEGKVHLYKLAVSDYDGRGLFHQIKQIAGLGVSMLDGKPHHTKDCDDVPIDVIQLDTFCLNANIQPTMIKIDTEGGELMVLKGAQSIIERFHPVIISEIEWQNTNQYGYEPQATMDYLSARGYTLTTPFGADVLAIYEGTL